MFGVPEALQSDCATNLLSCLMEDACRLLGIKELKTLLTIHSEMVW